MRNNQGGNTNNVYGCDGLSIDFGEIDLEDDIPVNGKNMNHYIKPYVQLKNIQTQMNVEIVTYKYEN